MAVPVEFLSDEQALAYGHFLGPPTQEQLERFFFLDDADRVRVRRRRSDAAALSYALQLGTVRFLGTFLADPLDLPWPVVVFVAGQLGIADASVVKRYVARQMTAYEQQWDIRRRYGYRDFADGADELRSFLEARAWLANDGPRALFDRATAWCVAHKVLLPGVTTLARLVSEVRAAAAERLWSSLYELAGDKMRRRMDALLVVPEGSRLSELERLRAAPARLSAAEMAWALERLGAVRDLGTGGLDLGELPAGRLVALARYGMAAPVGALREMMLARRTATLLATLRRLEAQAADEALDLFELLYATKVDAKAERSSAKDRLAALPRLARAAARLAAGVRVLMGLPPGSDVRVGELWAQVESAVGRARLSAALEVVDELVPDDEDDEGAKRAELVRRFATLRAFWPALVDVVPFGAAEAGAAVLAAAKALPGLFGRKKVTTAEIDESLLAGSWRRLVLPEGIKGLVDRRAYTLAVAEAFRLALRRRDVFVVGTGRWGDPTAKMLSAAAWSAQAPTVLEALQLPAEPGEHLERLAQELDDAYRGVAARLGTNEPATVKDGRVHLQRLVAQDEPASLVELRRTLDTMVPRVDLPDLVLEVHGWTGCLSAYTHLSEANARMDDLALSVAACLVAEACNLGYAPVVSRGHPALTRARLSYVHQNYVRAETHRAANAHLIQHQAGIGLAQAWGGGLVASADGMRFVVPVATVHAGPNPRYFGRGRGVTWLNVVSDHVLGIGAVVVLGTVRDSLYILDALLDIDAGPRPGQVITDTASYSDQVFGLFRLLGYQFSPRLADLPDQRWWRIDPDGDYGALNSVSRHRVNLGLVRDNWADLLRLAGSVLAHTVKASEVMRLTQGAGRPTTLGRALAEYGRVAKTLHLLAWVDDPDYRRAVGTRLNVGEGRHSLARKAFFGQRGELRQRYREGQEDQLSALGLVVNMVTLWNTRYMDAALCQLRAGGQTVHDEDVARLSPLGYDHINFHGHYSFSPPPTTLRPLRDPKTADQDE
jgi:TnpA family transposase